MGLLFFKSLTSPQTHTKWNNDLNNIKPIWEIRVFWVKTSIGGHPWAGGHGWEGFWEEVGLALWLKACRLGRDEQEGRGAVLRELPGRVMCEQCWFILEFPSTHMPTLLKLLLRALVAFKELKPMVSCQFSSYLWEAVDTVDHPFSLKPFVQLAAKALYPPSGFSNMLHCPFLLCCFVFFSLTSYSQRAPESSLGSPLFSVYTHCLDAMIQSYGLNVT